MKRLPFCLCGTEARYNESYDAYFCPLCARWLEATCDDADCDYCRDRPSSPSLTDPSSLVAPI